MIGKCSWQIRLGIVDDNIKCLNFEVCKSECFGSCWQIRLGMVDDNSKCLVLNFCIYPNMCIDLPFVLNELRTNTKWLIPDVCGVVSVVEKKGSRSEGER